MKKIYSAPMLTTHGSVPAITQYNGNKTKNDVYFFNGTPISTSPVDGSQLQGSEDGVVVPCSQAPGKCP